MTGTNPDTFRAKIDSVCHLIEQHRASKINWAECVRRADLTPKGIEILGALQGGGGEDFVRSTVTAAVQAGY